MNYSGSHNLPHPVERVWQALLDPQVLQQCIAGCEKFERTGDDEYKSTVKISIGPVSARFASTVTLADVVQPLSCTLKFSGQGGVAGFGRGEAHVRLTPETGGTRLDWDADAHVGGKLAQIGSRLIEATVRKMSHDFFVRFAAQLQSASEDDGAGPATTLDETAMTQTAAAPASRAKAIGVVLAACVAAAIAWWLAR